MPQVHILTGQNGAYLIACHNPAPAGNNAAGVPWQTAIVNAGYNKSVLAPVANDSPGPGQIGQTEYGQIQAGTLLEVVISVHADWAASLPTPLVITDAMVAAFMPLVVEQTTKITNALNYYGLTYTPAG